MRGRFCGLAAGVAVLALTGSAGADLELPIGTPLLGPNLGATLERGKTRPHVGAEVSFPVFWVLWAGPYADVVYDGRLRTSLGAEAGLLWFGVDGGFLVDFRNQGTGTGYVVRPTLTFPFGKHGVPRWPFFIGYWRYGRNTTFDRTFREWGVLVKLPPTLRAFTE